MTARTGFIVVSYSLIPAIFLFCLQVMNGSISAPALAGMTFFYLLVLAVGVVLRFYQERSQTKIDWLPIASCCFFILTFFISSSLTQPLVAWFMVAGWIIFNFVLERYLVQWKPWPLGLARSLVIASIMGAFLVLTDQIQTGFSEEEFFTAIQILELSAFLFLLLAVYRLLLRTLIQTSQVPSIRTQISVSGFYMLAFLAFLVFAMKSYQTSFYPQTAQPFPGLTEDTPFLCGDIKDNPVQDAQKSAQEILNMAVEKIKANPNKKPPEFGLLSLVTQDPTWQEMFRDRLLEEARLELYTQPANSVKYGQLDAAIRIYYYGKVREKYPALFSTQDQELLHAWFANINRRAMQVEWVDWMYATAFSMWPSGPYENQEIGAALLSMLVKYDLSAPELKDKNLHYLQNNRRGWQLRFRNTDDAFVYQPVWIISAYFQSLLDETGVSYNAQNSFAWILFQALPDGSAPQYNNPDKSSLAAVSMLAAVITKNGQYLWLAERALTRLDQDQANLYAYPGIEALQSLQLETQIPDAGSCLIYGNSGLPNQNGPLAPDKAVFRSGWGEDGRYLLVNLRSSGWHRYKGTNTITTVVHRDALVTEVLEQTEITWLPVGRSKVRDKRIPRQALNGLLVERYGLNAVLCSLTACTSHQAQDVAHAVDVRAFTTGDEFDYLRTVDAHWVDWTHQREIYFYHQGPVFILDQVNGVGNAAIQWTVSGDVIQRQQQVWVNNAEAGSAVIFAALETGDPAWSVQDSGRNITSIQFPSQNGKIRLLTVVVDASDDLSFSTGLDADGSITARVVRDGAETIYILPGQ